MRIPPTPPGHHKDWLDFLGKLNSAQGDESAKLMTLWASAAPTDEAGRYLPWSEFRFRQPPDGLDSRQFWALTRHAREVAKIAIPLNDMAGRHFSFVQTDSILRRLHEIDSEARGGVQFAGAAPRDHEARRFLVRSLVEEPFSSSVLEGAATTRDEAKRLINENKPPATNDERMVLNNYRAIEFIKSRTGDPLTPLLVHELHRVITDGTLKDSSKAGVFRADGDEINVVDSVTGEILHRPPPSGELNERLKNLCAFANGAESEKKFVHPVLRAIILHFMLAYDHPYVDGNGRTARALFYWSVVRDGYWLLEYVSISQIIRMAPTRYGEAFLHVETDASDLTYFLNHQLETISKALDGLGAYIRQKQAEAADINEALAGRSMRDRLNHRQLALLQDAVRNPSSVYSIADHQRINAVSYLTARADLEELAKIGFFVKSKRGNASQYRPSRDLQRRIARSKGANP